MKPAAAASSIHSQGIASASLHNANKYFLVAFFSRGLVLDGELVSSAFDWLNREVLITLSSNQVDVAGLAVLREHRGFGAASGASPDVGFDTGLLLCLAQLEVPPSKVLSRLFADVEGALTLLAVTSEIEALGLGAAQPGDGDDAVVSTLEVGVSDAARV